eukprot:jgi/Mesen1/4103/ME000216S03360
MAAIFSSSAAVTVVLKVGLHSCQHAASRCRVQYASPSICSLGEALSRKSQMKQKLSAFCHLSSQSVSRQMRAHVPGEIVSDSQRSMIRASSVQVDAKLSPLSPTMTTGTFLFTSESVNEGHPDKLCDQLDETVSVLAKSVGRALQCSLWSSSQDILFLQVSDAVLDACLEQDPDSKVACETCTKTNMVMVFGEITTKAKVDYEKIVRDTCREIGFTSAAVGLDCDNCKVLVNIEEQSPDIGQGVHGLGTKKPEDIGAGDQGHMFGYATDETEELMPLTHVLATKIGAKLTEVRKNGTCSWLRPDGKTQVTVEYKNEGGAMVPIRVHTVLISTQVKPSFSLDLKSEAVC